MNLNYVFGDNIFAFSSNLKTFSRTSNYEFSGSHLKIKRNIETAFFTTPFFLFSLHVLNILAW